MPGTRSLFADLMPSLARISVPPLHLDAAAGVAGDLSRFAGGGPAARAARPFRDLLRAGRVSGAEVRDRRGTADALDPHVLDPGDVGCDVAGGDDHLRGEGLIVTVTGAVEVRQQFGGVPADPLAGQAPGQRALADVAGAPEAARGLDEAGPRVERAAAGEEGGTGGEAADAGRVETETGVAARRPRGRPNQYNGRCQRRRH